MAIETVDKSLNRRLVEVTNIRGGLARLVAHHEGLGVDEAEGIDDDLTLDGLNRIDDDGNGAGCKLLK